MRTVLIVDDKADIREFISDILKDEGYAVVSASNASQAIEAFKQQKVSCVLLDIWLEGSNFDGIGVLKTLKSLNSEVPIIMISGHANIELAINTVKLGAYDFIEKPFKSEKLTLMVKRAIDSYKLYQENKSLKKNTHSATYIFAAKSSAQLVKCATSAALTRSRIVITGPVGSGKESLARFIHNHSPRASRQFVVVNCSEISVDNFDAKFLGQSGDELSLIQQANEGTLFVKNVDKLDSGAQVKLLKLLNESKNDVRYIFGSSRDLKELEASGKFNSDLYYRINVVPLNIEPLSERKEDIASLFKDFTKRLAVSLNSREIELSSQAATALDLYSWPGNVRELHNIAEWLMIIKGNDTGVIELADLPNNIVESERYDNDNWISNAFAKNLKDAREDFEKQYISTQLKRFKGNVSRTAEFIGIDRTALHRKMKNLF